MNLFSKSAVRNLVILAGLSAGFNAPDVSAADEIAAPKAHSDGVGTAIADTAITAEVKTQLLRKKSLKPSKIHVTTTNGVVTLIGSANNAEAKALAATTAESIAGVKSVDNQLKVPGANQTVAQTQQVVADSWITAQVKSALLVDSVAKGLDIKVETIHGVVVLTGILPTHAAITHVKHLAAQVHGVKSVDISGLFIADN